MTPPSPENSPPSKAISTMKTIVILGAGLAAIPLIRQTMVNTVLERNNLKLIVVAPNTHFQWPIAMPRAVVLGQLADNKVFIDLEPTFKDFPPSKFEFVQGKASSLEPASNLVTVALNDGGTQTVTYDVLIIATGARAREGMPWKSLDTSEKTKLKLHSLQEQVKNARTIVVAGGGITGVETAGEIGFEYSESEKDVFFIHDNPLPLGPPVIDSVRKQCKTELEKLKVNIIPNTTVVSATPSGNDIVLELRNSDGTTKSLTAQAYLPSTGIIPNPEFAPASLKDSKGYIKQTTQLQAEGHPNIFVIGDAGNLEVSKVHYAEAQAVHLIKNLPTYLDGGKMPEYAINPKQVFGITIGRSRGTGQVGTWKVFSFPIWFLKGRYLGTEYAEGWASGKRTVAKTFER
ncbi:Apoptosis-inducing factor 2 [Ilyonectria robusta]